MFLCSGQSLTDHEVEIPETIETQRLVKDLAKEIRLVEVGRGKYFIEYSDRAKLLGWPGSSSTIENI